MLLPSAEFRYNSAISEDLGLSPFQVDIGWQPKAPVDILFRAPTPQETLGDFRDRLSSVMTDTQYAHKLAKARQKAKASVYYKEPSYEVEDEVWVSRKLFRDSYSKVQASAKLSARRFGPFRILELIGKNAVRLDFPSHIRTHPVVHVSYTKPHRSQPADFAQSSRTAPVPVDPESLTPLFKVSRILAHRRRGRGYQWLPLMENARTHDAEWQPTRDFIDDDGALTKALHTYIVEKNLLRHLH